MVAPTLLAAPAVTLRAVLLPAARPLRVDAPAVTLKLLVPVTVVAPLRELAPVDVWKVPEELWASKLPVPAPLPRVRLLLVEITVLAPRVMPPVLPALMVTALLALVALPMVTSLG